MLFIWLGQADDWRNYRPEQLPILEGRKAHMPKVRVCLLAQRKQAELARSQLAELVAEFPLKSPFASELAKLGGRAL
jgi:hypothetical protein